MAAMDRLKADHQQPGEAVLSTIDVIVDGALRTLSEAGDQAPQSAGWSTEAVVDTELDTPHGFAMRVVSMSGSIRNRVMNLDQTRDKSTLELLMDVLDLTANFHALQTEFVNGAETKRGRSVLAGAKLGGEDGERLRESRAKHAEWKAEAMRVQAEKPELRKMDVARAVKRRLGLDVSLRTICRRI